MNNPVVTGLRPVTRSLQAKMHSMEELEKFYHRRATGRQGRNSANKKNRSRTSSPSSLCSPADSSVLTGNASEASLRTGSILHSCLPEPTEAMPHEIASFGNGMLPHKLVTELPHNHTVSSIKGTVPLGNVTPHHIAQDYLQESSPSQAKSCTEKANGHIRKLSNGVDGNNSCSSPRSAESSRIESSRKERTVHEFLILLHFFIAMLSAQDTRHNLQSRISSMGSIVLPLHHLALPMIAWLIGGVLCDVTSWKTVLLLSQGATVLTMFTLEVTTHQEVLKLMALCLPLLQQNFIACQAGILCVGSRRERIISYGRLTAVYTLVSLLHKPVFQHIGQYIGPWHTSWVVLALSAGTTFATVWKACRTPDPAVSGFGWHPAEYARSMMWKTGVTLLSTGFLSHLLSSVTLSHHPGLAPFSSNMELTSDLMGWFTVLVQCLGLPLITLMASSSALYRLGNYALFLMYGILGIMSASRFVTPVAVLPVCGVLSIMQTLVVASMSAAVAPKLLGLTLGINLILHASLRNFTQELPLYFTTLCRDNRKFLFSQDEDWIGCTEGNFEQECLQKDRQWVSLREGYFLILQLWRAALGLLHSLGLCDWMLPCENMEIIIVVVMGMVCCVIMATLNHLIRRRA